MRFGLTAKFALTLVALVIATALSISALWYNQSRTASTDLANIGLNALEQQSMEQAMGEAQMLIAMLADALVNEVYYYDMQHIAELVTAVDSLPNVSYVLVFDSEGKILHDGQERIPSFGQPMTDPFGETAANAEETVHQWSSDTLDIAAPLMLGNERIGGVRLGVSLLPLVQGVREARLQVEQETAAGFERHFESAMFMLVVLVVLACVVAVVGARQMQRPIARLVEYVSQLQAGHLGVKIDSQRSDEIGDLIRAFSSMSQNLRRKNRSIRHMAYHDSLTGLPNRLMFRELLDETIAADRLRRSNISLLFIDLDDFKRVNDTLGHDAGDEMLKQFSERLKSTVLGRFVEENPENECQSAVARLGGDEFIVMLAAPDARESAANLARLLLSESSDPYVVGGKSVFMSASIGITVYPDDSVTADFLLKNADIAMYHAKIRGKNSFAYFSYSMTAQADERLSLENDLRDALDQNQLELHFQPIVNMESGKIAGVEALVRWQHAIRGEVPPDIFVPIAEESGLIDRLGEWVLDRACNTCKDLIDAVAPDFYFAVNLSGRQLRRADVPTMVATTLERYDLNPSQLVLELTESTLLEDEEAASVTLRDIRATGARVFLDDFGTGFSGLSHLRQVPVDGVKIDRSFVSGLPADPDDVAIVAAIIAMAHSLGMTVTAEGVERTEQRAMLRDRGCDSAQGFLFGEAMSVADLRQWLTHSAQRQSGAEIA